MTKSFFGQRMRIISLCLYERLTTSTTHWRAEEPALPELAISSACWSSPYIQQTLSVRYPHPLNFIIMHGQFHRVCRNNENRWRQYGTCISYVEGMLSSSLKETCAYALWCYAKGTWRKRFVREQWTEYIHSHFMFPPPRHQKGKGSTILSQRQRLFIRCVRYVRMIK